MGDKKNVKKKTSIFDDEELEELEESEEKPKRDESKKDEKTSKKYEDKDDEKLSKKSDKDDEDKSSKKSEDDDEKPSKKSEDDHKKVSKFDDKKKNVEVKKEIRKSKFEDDEDDEDEADGDTSLGVKLVLAIIIIAVIVILLLKSCGSPKVEYKITFDTNGGSNVAEVVVEEDSKVSKPVDPTKEGYEFAGWYYNDELYDFSKPVTGDIVLEARWNELPEVDGITLDQTSLKLSPGGTTTLVATVSPENAYYKSLTWESSDTSVVTVDENGNVTAIKAGNATVTVKTENGEFTASATITVSNDVVAVTGVKLNKSSLTLSPNESSTLTATIAPSNASNKGVTWTSSNTSVATVSSTGMVTAKKDGTTVITVTSKDGSFTAKCNVTVKTVKVTGIRVSKTTVTLKEGKSTTVTATVLPSNATNKKVTWTSSDTRVAKVSSSGKITAVKEGTANITVKTADGNYSKTIKVTVTGPVMAESVTISGNASVQEGSTITLKANIKPADTDNKSVTWKSSNTSIATVSKSGVVKGIKPGKVKITVTTSNGKTATKEITVTEKPASYKVVLEAKYTGTEISGWLFTTFKNNVKMSPSEYKGLSCGGVSTNSGAGQLSRLANPSGNCTLTLLDGNKVTASATWNK